VINPNKYIKITGVVVSIDHFLGDAVVKTGSGELVTVDIGRSNKLSVHVGDTVRAVVNYRIVSERYYGPVTRNLDSLK
jgi:S1-C subfamily serine protease